MRAIFISYRRDDAEGQAGRLFGDLTQLFGADTVFMDVAAIEPGRDFRRAIDQQVAECGVLLALVGKNWLTAKDGSGVRRIDNPMDFVRLETASALKRDIPVVPVLVQGAGMPREEDLPEDLRELAFRNAVELTHARWDSDLQVLVKALRPYVQVTQGSPSSPQRSTPHEPISKRVFPLQTVVVGVVSVLLLGGGWYLWRPPAASVHQPGVAPPSTRPPEVIVPPKPPVCSKLYADERLYPDQSIKSCDGRFRLLLQLDGNLVLYQGDTPLWGSSTVGKASAVAVMQGDGNLAIYDAQAKPLWASGTSNHPGAHLVVQNDGNVVIYDSANRPLWHTNTCCH